MKLVHRTFTPSSPSASADSPLGGGVGLGLEACGLGSFGTRGQGCGLLAFRFLLRLLDLGERGADVTFRLE
jgi:hypothetical protein